MLVLTRKDAEAVRIGDDIVVRVVRLEGGRVRLGIDAPSQVPIQREELVEPIVGSTLPGPTRIVFEIGNRLPGSGHRFQPAFLDFLEDYVLGDARASGRPARVLFHLVFAVRAIWLLGATIVQCLPLWRVFARMLGITC